MKKISPKRKAPSTTLWSMAFRPFFLLGTAYSILALLAWGLLISGVIPWNGKLSARMMHAHEMLFGFCGAAIAGFLLTAVATWTQRPPISGRALQWLVGFWVFARLGTLVTGASGILPWAVSSLAFWSLLGLLMAREVANGQNRRNDKVIPLIAGFTLLEGLFFFGSEATANASLRAGLFLIINMIMLVAGRIIPSFTNNWLHLNRRDIAFRLKAFDHFDLLAIGVTNIFAVFFILEPEQEHSAYFGMAAALLQFGRVLRWRGWITRSEPLLSILHLGYSWIPVGLGLLGASHFLGHRAYDAGIHALTFGAIGTLILGISARVALGHTGRRLAAFPIIRVAFILMTLGAFLRVALPQGEMSLHGAIGLWVLAYGLFIFRYTPILLEKSQRSE